MDRDLSAEDNPVTELSTPTSRTTPGGPVVVSVRERPATVAVSSPDGYTFLFGDPETGSGSAAITAFVQSYQKSGYGLVPWRERAEVLRKGMIARVPPMAWSPGDGRPPK